MRTRPRRQGLQIIRLASSALKENAHVPIVGDDMIEYPFFNKLKEGSLNRTVIGINPAGINPVVNLGNR